MCLVKVLRSMVDLKSQYIYKHICISNLHCWRLLCYRFINPNWTTPNVNTSIFSFSDGFSRTIGYTQVSYFDVDNPAVSVKLHVTWTQAQRLLIMFKQPTWNTPVPLTTASDQFSARHQSVFDPVTNMLLFMGGEYRTTTSQDSLPRPYSYIKAFNTLTNEWSMMNLTGNMPTPGRIYSTLTLCNVISL